MFDCRVVILAAGKGKRMGADGPKVLVPISGKPMIEYLVESVHASGIDEKPLIVVGHEMEKVKACLQERCEFVIQQQQLGTGHALQCALSQIGDAKYIILLYGDHAFTSSKTIYELAKTSVSVEAPVTLMVLQTPDFEGWHSAFFDYGRIVRDKKGEVERIVERRDATEDQLKIMEVNPGYYGFRVNWLKEHIAKLENKNAQQEFYVTDLIGLAILQGFPVKTIVVTNPLEGIGVNTPEQLRMAEEAFRSAGENI
ncbi:MAG: Bifunctional protein GlmU [Candidatus Uhrbacteria bacterium GW2011_GWF2_41_16]|uniref:Bifunctional protein GlmU n=2 Tax=Candidatus Uhriibacteriota TaxID=1752732 RepID=A0A0G0V7F6_9BACT|nr:MAG: Bifunctional protein GlmU [Candidatus Uhrbacteria bacterium GW2011_GWA2_41_10]KKR85967.1 MAG: Bifunctional protein GlmU [Candidatus Uhrbacteria bacterium GW2011_GWC2_41_11]KKR96879.1 MAG: Bifunctional protein GlmU [Candidatus Uhrbacteria bacterium GW2011_GWF2_41_16]HBP00292.1 hypothetical protein [Candidatus Uhrbacteria bacterium]